MQTYLATEVEDCFFGGCRGWDSWSRLLMKHSKLRKPTKPFGKAALFLILG